MTEEYNQSHGCSLRILFTIELSKVGSKYIGICPILKNISTSVLTLSTRTRYISPRLPLPLTTASANAEVAPARQKISVVKMYKPRTNRLDTIRFSTTNQGRAIAISDTPFIIPIVKALIAIADIPSRANLFLAILCSPKLVLIRMAIAKEMKMKSGLRLSVRLWEK